MICCEEEMRHTNLGYYVCEKCGRQENDELGIIKKALEEHPGANAIDLVRYTGLSSKVILAYMNDGVLTNTKKTKSIKGYYAGNQKADKWHFNIPMFRRN